MTHDTDLSTQPLGLDIGGTGMKAAPVDLDAGDFAEIGRASCRDRVFAVV